MAAVATPSALKKRYVGSLKLLGGHGVTQRRHHLNTSITKYLSMLGMSAVDPQVLRFEAGDGCLPEGPGHEAYTKCWDASQMPRVNPV